MTTLYAFVTGPAQSGKTSFLQSLGDPQDFWIDEENGLEFRRLLVEEGDDPLEVYLFCSIDAARFDQLIQISQRDLLGYILMVDSSNSETWEEAQAMLSTCRGYALQPTVICANKQDISGAYSPEQVGAWIGMDSMIAVQGCIAIDGESARNVILHLLYSVRNEIERLDKLIAELERLSTENRN